MLCFRCGSQAPDGAPSCPNCGQKFAEPGVNLASLQGRFKVLDRKGRAVEPKPAADDGSGLEPGTELQSRYLILDRISRASLGTVYRVKDREIDGEVALKLFPAALFPEESSRENFRRQIRKVKRLSQQNVVRIYDEGVVDGRPFYTMQLLEGGMSLHKIISLRRTRDSLFDLQETEPILAQISLGLQYAHRSGCHGCLKPEDIVVLPDVVKIVDFAVASAIEPGRLLAAVQAAGTDAYLAPEQRRGGPPDVRADIYSLGIILCEMLAGVRTLAPNELLSDKNPALPPAIDKLILRALADDPADRYRSVEELTEDLTSIIDTGRAIDEAIGGQSEVASLALLESPPPMPADMLDDVERPLPPRLPSSPDLTPSGAPRDPSLPPTPATDATDHDILIEEVIELAGAAPATAPAPAPPDVLFDDRLLDAWAVPAGGPGARGGRPVPVPVPRGRKDRSLWGLAFGALLILAIISVGTYLFISKRLGQRQGHPIVAEALVPGTGPATPSTVSPGTEAGQQSTSTPSPVTSSPEAPAPGVAAGSAAIASSAEAPAPGVAAGSAAIASSAEAPAPGVAAGSAATASSPAASLPGDAPKAVPASGPALSASAASPPAPVASVASAPAAPLPSAATTAPGMTPGAVRPAGPAAVPPVAPKAAPLAAAPPVAGPAPARPPTAAPAVAPPAPPREPVAARLPAGSPAPAPGAAVVPSSGVPVPSSRGPSGPAAPAASAARPPAAGNPPAAAAGIPDWSRQSLEPTTPAPAATTTHGAAGWPVAANPAVGSPAPRPASAPAPASGPLPAAAGPAWPTAAPAPSPRPSPPVASPPPASAPAPAAPPVAAPPAVAPPVVSPAAAAPPVVLAAAPAPPPSLPAPVPAAAPDKPTKCPGGMVKIQKGKFVAGAKEGDRDRGFEGTARAVETRAYCIDVYEYPNRAGAQPMAGVDLAAARRLCAAQDKRLCDAAEWEKACKGPKGAAYPYGATFDPDVCVTEDRKEEGRAVSPAGSFKKCRSGYGVYDMSGNLAEWTEGGTMHGGSAQKPDYSVRCTSKARKSADAFTGFRCCRDAQ
ncbi:MAG: SUMF1/EgtB/PvdO family nonheme iron enzyme [Myxococcota bacterium]|nr:SUMF1/EgtB/PvdO family nonheme iron enzyme [Myxococcota bacterium]